MPEQTPTQPGATPPSSPAPTPSPTPTCAPLEWHPDRDEDGAGDSLIAVTQCQAPLSEDGTAWITEGGDCDDGNEAIPTQSVESCDGVDEDCDGQVDEGFSTKDETCDGIDEDCDGSVDEEILGDCDPLKCVVQACSDWHGSGKCFESIRDALGDVDCSYIVVGPGTYSENTGEGPLEIDQAITLISAAGASETIIDAGGIGGALEITADATVRGFTVKNGQKGCPVRPTIDSCTYSGGGVCIKGASPTLSDLIIRDNSACWGGGIAIIGGSPTLQDIGISNNHAKGNSLLDPTGGGLMVVSSDDALDTVPTIARVLVHGNSAAYGGGIAVKAVGGGRPHVYLHSALITSNEASTNGGGVFLQSADLTADQLSLSNNSEGTPGDESGAGIDVRDDAHLDLARSIVGYSLTSAPNKSPLNLYAVNDAEVTLADSFFWLPESTSPQDSSGVVIPGGGPEGGAVDPAWPAPTPSDGCVPDLRLSEGSLLRDQGSPDTRWDDPWGGRNDPGVFGGPEAASLDFNHDGTPGDYEPFSGTSPPRPEDLPLCF